MNCNVAEVFLSVVQNRSVLEYRVFLVGLHYNIGIGQCSRNTSSDLID